MRWAGRKTGWGGGDLGGGRGRDAWRGPHFRAGGGEPISGSLGEPLMRRLMSRREGGAAACGVADCGGGEGDGAGGVAVSAVQAWGEVESFSRTGGRPHRGPVSRGLRAELADVMEQTKSQFKRLVAQGAPLRTRRGGCFPLIMVSAAIGTSERRMAFPVRLMFRSVSLSVLARLSGAETGAQILWERHDHNTCRDNCKERDMSKNQYARPRQVQRLVRRRRAGVTSAACSSPTRPHVAHARRRRRDALDGGQLRT